MESQFISKVHLNHLTSIVNFKLKEDNFLTWKSVNLSLLNKFQVADYVIGERACPEQFTTHDNADNNIVNPAFTLWQDEDSTIILWLNSTIYDSILPYFASALQLLMNYGATLNQDYLRALMSMASITSTLIHQ
ncbi:uncharacterized protein LOC113331194 isoform X2 [Papaver somniferum]|uniref:uncharacterized protein LOC113331194 isoform X2 n=1 Tax=Papaver somniferum TaxID=3469 RepID=UPI000E7041DA|nr:uncharacterized protein LOC113331194 isoform X2 [Papaver somniferum]